MQGDRAKALHTLESAIRNHDQYKMKLSPHVEPPDTLDLYAHMSIKSSKFSVSRILFTKHAYCKFESEDLFASDCTSSYAQQFLKQNTVTDLYLQAAQVGIARCSGVLSLHFDSICGRLTQC